MKRTTSLLHLAVILFCYASAMMSAKAQWTPPTPEELSMTSQNEVPGAPAVYLFREETTDDKLHMFSIYVRLKVLTERGKEYANVELPYVSRSDGGGFTVDNVMGRTIHADGTVIPFTGKPMQKVVEKSTDVKVMSKVFTLPDVEVGSIIEYRYKLRNDEQFYRAPNWYIQSDLYTRKAHYVWTPTDKRLVTNDDRGELTSTVSWTPILPPGVAVKQARVASAEFDRDGSVILELNVHDIPPAPKEELMPPIQSFTYRVLFYYSPYHTWEEYWRGEGKHWGKLQDQFIGPGNGVRAAVQQIALPADSQEQKLRKFYAAVMEMENTDFARKHSESEDKTLGLHQLHTTDDVLARKRGSGDQLTSLFVAMARASGMKAYLMSVTNRDRNLFTPNYLSLSQLDDSIAIVVVDGKEQFFDPGSRYCPYGHLAWKHTFAQGLRQGENGVTIATAPGDGYSYSRLERVANLTMDEQGSVTGTVKFTYYGSAALRWRQVALMGDEISLNRDMRTSAEQLLPGGMEIKISTIDNLYDYEKPLNVVLDVKGAIGSPTGRRLLIPSDIFEGNTHPLFPHEKREQAVYFEYCRRVQDAIHISFPSSFVVESLPAKEIDKLKTEALYSMATESTPTSFTIRRDYILGDIVFLPPEYPELRSFYSKMETKDQESVVLSRTTGDTAGQ